MGHWLLLLLLGDAQVRGQQAPSLRLLCVQASCPDRAVSGEQAFLVQQINK